MEQNKTEFQLLRSDRKSISIQISRSGEVLVRCPRWMHDEDIRCFVMKHENWVRRQLEKQQEAPQATVLSEEELEELTKLAKSRIPERVEFYSQRMGVSYGRITIRHQHSKWGSCSSKGNLNFNCLLMLAPEDVLDYIVVHELCHLLEMNHSQQFWEAVERILPDYRNQEKWLKEKGSLLMARLP